MDIGKVERINRSDIWPDSQAFTTWLAGNIQQLSEITGTQFSHVESMDDTTLLAHSAKDRVLVISQLESTDLGQVILDIAEVEASTVIWIAEQFTPDHQKAIDWLNKNTRESLRFFAVQMEVWKIGDSAVAPKFEVIRGPEDEITKQAEKQGRVSDKMIIAFIAEHPGMKRANVADHFGISARTVYNACNLSRFLAKTGRYVSMLRLGEDMSQCSQVRIGPCFTAFCPLFLSALLPHSHQYRH